MPASRLPGLERALHPLGAVPEGPGWNIHELEDLLPREVRHVQAAVLVGLLVRDNGVQVLFTRRTEALRHHAGQVSFPGGRVESGDGGPLAAALREAEEEIGMQAGQVEPVGWLDPLATITGYRVLPVVGWIAQDFVPRPDPGEVAEVFEVPLAHLLAPDALQRVDIEYAGRIRHVLEIRARDGDVPARRIWGATASILANLRDRLGASR